MSSPVIELLKVNFRSFFREPGIIFWAILFPIIMAWVLGLAFTEKTEIRKTVYVLDGAASLDTLYGKSYSVPGLESPVTLKFEKADSEQSILGMKRGEINLFLEQEGEKIKYHYDPLNPDAVNTHLLLEKLLFPHTGIQAEIKPVTTTGNRYIDFLIPGLIALGIMNSCMWGISYTLIELRMKKLLRRMLATPMKKSDYLIAQFIFRVIICAIEAVLLVSFAVLFFGLKVQGSWLAFLLLFMAGVICFTGIAILVASRARNTQIGNGLMNAVILPMTVLSGIFFSYHNFPSWAEGFIKYLPLTILADHIRAVFNEGAGLESVYLPLAILTGVGSVCYIAGVKIFRWY
jgi:ABC-2 type transport system permease protein